MSAYHKYSLKNELTNSEFYDEAVNFQQDMLEYWELFNKQIPAYLSVRNREKKSFPLPTDPKKYEQMQRYYQQIEKFISFHRHNLDTKEAMDYLEFLSNSLPVSYTRYQATEAINERFKPKDHKEATFTNPQEVIDFLSARVKSFDQKFKVFFVKKSKAKGLSQDQEFLALLRKTEQDNAQEHQEEKEDDFFLNSHFFLNQQDNGQVPLISLLKNPDSQCPLDPFQEKQTQQTDATHLVVVCKEVFQAHFRLTPAQNYKVRFLSIHPDISKEGFNEGVSRSNDFREREQIPFKEEFDERRYYRIEPEDLPESNEFRKMTLLAQYSKQVFSSSMDHNLYPLMEWCGRYKELFTQKCSLCKKIWSYDMSVVHEGETSAEFPTYNSFNDARSQVALKHINCLQMKALGGMGNQV